MCSHAFVYMHVHVCVCACLVNVFISLHMHICLYVYVNMCVLPHPLLLALFHPCLTSLFFTLVSFCCYILLLEAYFSLNICISSFQILSLLLLYLNPLLFCLLFRTLYSSLFTFHSSLFRNPLLFPDSLFINSLSYMCVPPCCFSPLDKTQ